MSAVDENFYKLIEVLINSGVKEVNYPLPSGEILCIIRKDGYLYDKKSNKKLIPFSSVNHPVTKQILFENSKKLISANKVDPNIFLKEFAKKK